MLFKIFSKGIITSSLKSNCYSLQQVNIGIGISSMITVLLSFFCTQVDAGMHLNGNLYNSVLHYAKASVGNALLTGCSLCILAGLSLNS